MKASVMALGGVTAALALVIMCLGGLIPMSTYVCPVICCLLLRLILSRLGKRNAWVWYAAVSILCLLMGPDKEASAVFIFLGYYPIIKPWLDSVRFGMILKLIFFNVSTLLMYWLLIHLFGMAALAEEFTQLGFVMGCVTLVLGNVTFLLLDILLSVVCNKIHI